MAIQSLQPHAIGSSPLSAPDTPRGFMDNGETVDTAWKPYGPGPEPYSRGLEPQTSRPPNPFGGPNETFKRRSAEPRGRGGRAPESYGRGPEPFSLEKITAEPSMMSDVGETISLGDIPKSEWGMRDAGIVA